MARTLPAVDSLLFKPCRCINQFFPQDQCKCPCLEAIHRNSDKAHRPPILAIYRSYGGPMAPALHHIWPTLYAFPIAQSFSRNQSPL